MGHDVNVCVRKHVPILKKDSFFVKLFFRNNSFFSFALQNHAKKPITKVFLFFLDRTGDICENVFTMTKRYFNPWKKEPKADIKKLAKRLDMHSVYISAVLHGRSRPSKKLGRNIEKKTGGLITYEALIENFLSQRRDD